MLTDNIRVCARTHTHTCKAFLRSDSAWRLVQESGQHVVLVWSFVWSRRGQHVVIMWSFMWSRRGQHVIKTFPTFEGVVNAIDTCG